LLSFPGQYGTVSFAVNPCFLLIILSSQKEACFYCCVLFPLHPPLCPVLRDTMVQPTWASIPFNRNFFKYVPSSFWTFGFFLPKLHATWLIKRSCADPEVFRPQILSLPPFAGFEVNMDISNVYMFFLVVGFFCYLSLQFWWTLAVEILPDFPSLFPLGCYGFNR